MVKLKNKLRQPLVINVGKESVHFLAKETKDVTSEDFNTDDIKRHIALGNLIVLRME